MSDVAGNTYGIVILSADASTPHETFTPSVNFFSPDCDPAPIPVPEGGAIEGETGYACVGGGDCHLIVVDEFTCRLHEMWVADRTSDSQFDGGCQAIWDLTAQYRETLRGDCCTSADAAGLPIAPLMVTADEIAAGRIEHALRFILPNAYIRDSAYASPATHATAAASGGANAPPYGARMRLRDDVDISSLSPGAQVVATALKEYGMFLADGGNITFTFANDRFTTAKWSEVDLSAADLTGLAWTDFEVLDLGIVHDFSACSCTRTPITN